MITVRVLGFAAAAACSLLASPVAQAQDTIRVGWTIPAEEAKYWMMRRPQAFPELGKAYKIEWSQFNGTSPMTSAMQAGALDCATQGVLPIAQSMAAGNLQLYVIAQHVGDDAQIDALAEMEPHVPWEREFLRSRLAVYERKAHPRARQAARDMNEYLAWMPEPFILRPDAGATPAGTGQ